jgi:hypothetical protein
MKRRSEFDANGANQLALDLVCPSEALACSLSVPETAGSHRVTGVVVDLTPVLRQRATENDHALLRAVQARAAHLSDCLVKRP